MRKLLSSSIRSIIRVSTAGATQVRLRRMPHTDHPKHIWCIRRRIHCQYLSSMFVARFFSFNRCVFSFKSRSSSKSADHLMIFAVLFVMTNPLFAHRCDKLYRQPKASCPKRFSQRQGMFFCARRVSRNDLIELPLANFGPSPWGRCPYLSIGELLKNVRTTLIGIWLLCFDSGQRFTKKNA